MAGEKFNFWSKKPGGITGTEIWPIQSLAGGTGESWVLDPNDMAEFSKEYLGGIIPTTIGTGGDYATVGAAVAAGKSGIFQLLSSVTETGNTSKVTGTEPAFTILPSNFTWNLSTYTFLYRAVKNIYCNVTNPNFTYNNIDSQTNIHNSTVTLSSTGGNYINFYNCTVSMPNANITYTNCSFYNGQLIGNNTASRLTLTGGKIINNRFSSTWAATFCSMNAGNTIPSEFSKNYGTITGTLTISGTDSYFLSDNQMENVSFQNADSGNTRYIFINNCHFAAYLQSGGAINFYNISNSRFKTLATLPTHAVSFSNCIFDASISTQTTATNTKCSNCRFAVNLTVGTGATGTKFYGNTVVGTYTDNGTGTVNL